MTKKQIIWTIVIVVIALLIIFRKNIANMFGADSSKQSGVKCCTQRDINCQCTNYEYKKSEDCVPVPCPEVRKVTIKTYPSGGSRPTGNDGIGHPMPIGSIV